MAMASGFGSWRLVKNTNNVQVYNRTIEGSVLSESKAVTIINTNISKLHTMVMDVPNIPQWMFKVSRCERLATLDDQNFYILAEIDAPWPISDRDVILHFTITPISDTQIHPRVPKKTIF